MHNNCIPILSNSYSFFILADDSNILIYSDL